MESVEVYIEKFRMQELEDVPRNWSRFYEYLDWDGRCKQLEHLTFKAGSKPAMPVLSGLGMKEDIR